jgi:hypothetical protein
MSRDIEMKAWHIQNLMDVDDDIQVVPMIDAREVVESLEADNKVLTARIKALEDAGNDALADMLILFKNQARDPSDGSYLVDGQCANELNFLINSGVSNE